jgi:hypothetical protein
VRPPRPAQRLDAGPQGVGGRTAVGPAPGGARPVRRVPAGHGVAHHRHRTGGAELEHQLARVLVARPRRRVHPLAGARLAQVGGLAGVEHAEPRVESLLQRALAEELAAEAVIVPMRARSTS